MFRTIKRISDKHEDIKVIYSTHMNPVFRITAN